MNRLSAVIVNYRSGKFLEDCLACLFKAPALLDFEVFVVNNDSTIDLEPLRRFSHRIEFIQNRSNIGFASAVNQGFQRSRGEWILVLNPDVLVQEQTIPVLIETLQSDPETGVVLPKLINPDGSLQYSCRRFYTYTALAMRRAPFSRIFPDHSSVQDHLMLDWSHDRMTQVDWGLGAAMLIRRSAIQEPFLFDERFFLYFEDVDLCLRMRRRGWKVVYNPAATAVHQHRRESARHFFNPAKWHHLLSLLKFLRKYHGLGTRGL
jgi:GT2 family glycosyltransferase